MITSEQLEAFIQDILAVSKKHGMCYLPDGYDAVVITRDMRCLARNLRDAFVDTLSGGTENEKGKANQ